MRNSFFKMMMVGLFVLLIIDMVLGESPTIIMMYIAGLAVYCGLVALVCGMCGFNNKEGDK